MCLRRLTIVHILGPSGRDDLNSMRPCPTKEVSSYRREVNVQLVPKGEAVTERLYPVQSTLCYKGTTVQVSRFYKSPSKND